MHHVHVNCKEQTMNRYMIDEYHRDPALLRRRLTAQAHLERSKAVGDAIAALFSSVGRLFNYVKTRLAPRSSRWIERLG
jgi:hypothetical protein